MTVERKEIEEIRKLLSVRRKIEGQWHRATLDAARTLLAALDERSRSLDAAMLTIADLLNRPPQRTEGAQ